ncbi:AIPR family protein [Romboutsia sedimentorum]|uniref:AIPR family protein n=1 Tax=Romboutsia sedimentorum TaxID=1368474 RepID=A0ABT7E5L4_9FIRM|nr:AIPR family protein [Romboutsia sedimentorum]MDK2562216.1 AIPR family protein [Romboutsia sedimentorum]
MKYDLLTEILDSIRKESPNYKPGEDNEDALSQARCKAYIHLLLKVKFKINDFTEREKFITDKSQDGGLDAYYIDKNNKIIYLIQSKFRTTESNFEKKDIELDELVKMEYDKIMGGEHLDSRGTKYNSKIINFQKELKSISGISRYKYKILVLANLKKYNGYQIDKVIGKYTYEIFDYKKTYEELIYPMCTSSYHKNINIDIDLHQENISILNEKFEVEVGKCEVNIVFLPVYKIAEIMSKYKNSVLKYNPRNYISISKSTVNNKIYTSVIKDTSQEFAILNNGITIICDDFNSTEQTGKQNRSQISIDNPQFINGAQTSYTLSKVYNSKDKERLRDKKVMVRFIKVDLREGIDREKDQYKKFIQKISDATNTQNKVNESDKKSNRPDQEKFQAYIYREFGYLYERKVGEFDPLLSNENINTKNIKDLIIERSDLIRSRIAYKGKARFAMNTKGDKLFTEKNLDEVFSKEEDYKDIFLSYLVYKKILEKEKECKEVKEKELNYRYGVTYGKFVMLNAISIIRLKFFKDRDCNGYKDICTLAEELLGYVLKEWKKFEEYAKSVNKDLDINDRVKMYSYYKTVKSEGNVKDFFESIV